MHSVMVVTVTCDCDPSQNTRGWIQETSTNNLYLYQNYLLNIRGFLIYMNWRIAHNFDYIQLPLVFLGLPYSCLTEGRASSFSAVNFRTKYQ